MFKSFLEGKDYFVKSVPFLDRLGKIYSPLEIKADAAGNPLLGLSCFLPHTGEWFGKLWFETDWFHKSAGLEAHRVIYQLELFTITLAFKVFGSDIQGQVVILRSDNIAVVNSINKMISHLKSAMDLLRELTLTCLSLQILAKVVHIPGFHNRESDLISRDKSCQFLKENPRSRNRMKEVTTKLWPPSWRPSMLQRSLGKTEFRKASQGPFASFKKRVKGNTSHWN